jgi:hypothetical protein
MGHLAEIEAWLATLTTSQRLHLNHPTSVLRKWKVSTFVPDPNAPPKPPSAQAKMKAANIELQEENYRLKQRGAQQRAWQAAQRRQAFCQRVLLCGGVRLLPGITASHFRQPTFAANPAQALGGGRYTGSSDANRRPRDRAHAAPVLGCDPRCQ